MPKAGWTGARSSHANQSRALRCTIGTPLEADFVHQPVLTTISTRRFFCRLAALSDPSGFVFGTAGFDFPHPRVLMGTLTLWAASHSCTALARRSESAWL